MSVLQLKGSVKIIKKTPFDESSNSEEELLAEYQFDYQKAKPNRLLLPSGRRKITVVVLDEDVAQIFTTAESVNKALRAIISAIPQANASAKE